MSVKLAIFDVDGTILQSYSWRALSESAYIPNRRTGDVGIAKMLPQTQKNDDAHQGAVSRLSRPVRVNLMVILLLLILVSARGNRRYEDSLRKIAYETHIFNSKSNHGPRSTQQVLPILSIQV